MGLGVILPLLLILNLGMSPGVAGLVLLSASLPLIAIAPLVGRWYERAGARPPMTSGYALLAIGGVLLAIGGFQFNYWFVLPGLLAYGAGLAVVLTVTIRSVSATSLTPTMAKPPASPLPRNNSAAHWASRCSI